MTLRKAARRSARARASASPRLARLRQAIAIEYDKQDRYKRTLGKVIVEGRDANLEQIKAGMAWHYKFYENEQPPQDKKTYAEAEVEARAAKRGLWVDPNPTPPWTSVAVVAARRRTANNPAAKP